MSVQSRILDRERWVSHIHFLEKHGKEAAASEMRDILKLVSEAEDQGSTVPELAHWINSFEIVLEAVESWRFGPGKEKLFDLYWQHYRAT